MCYELKHFKRYKLYRYVYEKLSQTQQKSSRVFFLNKIPVFYILVEYQQSNRLTRAKGNIFIEEILYSDKAVITNHYDIFLLKI